MRFVQFSSGFVGTEPFSVGFTVSIVPDFAFLDNFSSPRIFTVAAVSLLLLVEVLFCGCGGTETGGEIRDATIGLVGG